VNPMGFFVPGDDSFIDKYEWKPERGTRFVVVDRHTGEVVGEPRAKPFFAFHHVNAFQRDDDLLLDVVAYPDPSVIDSMYLEAVRSGSVEFPVGELRRYRVSLDGDGSRIEHRPLYEGGIELPTVAPSVRRAPYRYVYGQGGERDDGADRTLPNQLVKVDVREGFARIWLEDGAYVGEPVFVPRPNPVREDDGVVLSVVLDANSERSFLLVLDAETFDELARAWLPHALPFDFHGQFFETDA